MGKIDLYKNHIDGKEMLLSVKKFNSKISECEVFNKREFILIGISLGNSYFNNERLELLIRGFSKNFKRVAVLLVDDLSAHNYRAMGYDERKIQKKIKNNANNTVNKIKKAINKANDLYKENNIEFYRWKDIEEFKGYENALKAVSKLYEEDKEFKINIDSSVKDMIEKYLNFEFTQEVLDEAKWYFLKEIAFGCCINDIFKEEQIATSYYQDFKFYREFFENNYLSEYDNKSEELIIYDCIVLDS